MLCSVTVYP